MFIKYAISRYKKEQTDMAYAIYMSDTLYYQNQQKGLSMRFFDLINQNKEPDESGDEILSEVMAKAGLRFKE